MHTKISKNETLIIKENDNDLVGNLIKNRGYNIERMYKGNRSIILRFLRRMFFKYKIPFYRLWFNSAILLHRVDNIIIFESLLTPLLVSWIKKNMVARVHIWYWNIVKNTVNPSFLRKYDCTIWTFSRLDAKKYSMLFNPPPYFHEIKKDLLPILYDVVFVGKDKGRLNQLLKIRDIFEGMGISLKLVVTPDRRYHRHVSYSPQISYSDSIKLSCQSRAVLDFIEINNSGQSMRIMESLFLENKIITNNVLIKDYDFYNKDNIFILGVDDLKSLYSFLETPYCKIDNKIVMQYDFDAFFERFLHHSNNYWWSKEMHYEAQDE